MEIVETKKERLMRGYEAVVPASVIENMIDEQLEDYAARASIPGFRRGMVSKAVVKQRFGGELKKEIIQNHVGEIMNGIREKFNVKAVASEPQVSTTILDSGDVKYDIEFELQPDVPSVNFGTVSIKVNKITITDQDVDKVMKERFDENNTKWDVAKKSAEKGDRVHICYTTKVRNKFIEKSVKIYVRVGDMEKFDGNFLGKSAGDKVNFDYEYKPGKVLNYDVEVLEVAKPSKFDAINDEYAKAIGFADLSGYKSEMRKFVENAAAEIYEREKIDGIRSVLLECLPGLEAPVTFVNIEAYLLMQEYAAGRLDIPGLDTAKTDEERKAVVFDLAEKDVKIGLIVRKVGEDQGIKVTEKDVRKAIQERLFPEVRNVREVEAKIFEDKVFKKIESLIKIEENPISFSQFEKLHTPEDVSALKGGKKPTSKAAGKSVDAGASEDPHVHSAECMCDEEKGAKKPKTTKKTTKAKTEE